MAALLNDLYTTEWNAFRNFLCPVMKRLRAERVGSRKRLLYDQPTCERFLASGQLSPEN